MTRPERRPTAADRAGRTTRRSRGAAQQPYPPSWLDRLTGWIERLPGPPWLAYLALLLLGLAAVSGARWLAGVQRPGRVEPFTAWLVIFTVYGLAAYHYLDRRAALALERFRPALDVGAAEFARLRYRLTTLPPRTALLTAAAGLLSVALITLWVPARYAHQFAAGVFGLGLLGGLISAAALALLFTNVHGIARQLWLVSHMHRLAARVDLYRPEPLYAFSGLTARAGLVLLGAAYLSLVAWPIQVLADPLAILPYAVISVLALACFALPLASMHRRLAGEKRRLQAEATAVFQALTGRLHERVQSDRLERMDDLNKAMASVVLELERLERLSTWPWVPGTLRALLSALLLPLLLGVATRLLEAWFPPG